MWSPFSFYMFLNMFGYNTQIISYIDFLLLFYCFLRNKFFYCNLLIIKRKYLSLERLWEIVSLKITKNIEVKHD